MLYIVYDPQFVTYDWHHLDIFRGVNKSGRDGKIDAYAAMVHSTIILLCFNVH